MNRTFITQETGDRSSRMTFRLSADAARGIPATLVTNSRTDRNGPVLLKRHADGSVTLSLTINGSTEHFVPYLVDLVSRSNGHCFPKTETTV